MTVCWTGTLDWPVARGLVLVVLEKLHRDATTLSLTLLNVLQLCEEPTTWRVVVVAEVGLLDVVRDRRVLGEVDRERRIGRGEVPARTTSINALLVDSSIFLTTKYSTSLFETYVNVFFCIFAFVELLLRCYKSNTRFGCHFLLKASFEKSVFWEFRRYSCLFF